MRKTSFLLVTIAAFGACDDKNDGPMTVSQAISSYADAYCTKLKTCPSNFSDGAWRKFFLAASPDAACHEYAVGLIKNSFNFEASVAAGKATLDEAKVKACATAIAACGNPDTVPACRQAFEGKTPTGGVCSDASECAGDAYCKFVPGSCNRVCAPRVAIGATCDDVDQCSEATDATCDFEHGKCVALTHAENAPANGECGEVMSSAGITTTTCASGLTCDSEGDGGAVCKKLAAVGETCGNETPCTEPLSCVQGKCTAITIANKVGDTCQTKETEEPTALCNPLAGLFCGAGGKCQAYGNGTAGAFCVGAELSGVYGCGAGLYCETVDESIDAGTCKPIVAEGGACSWDSECATHYCDQATSKCAVSTTSCL